MAQARVAGGAALRGQPGAAVSTQILFSLYSASPKKRPVLESALAMSLNQRMSCVIAPSPHLSFFDGGALCFSGLGAGLGFGAGAGLDAAVWVGAAWLGSLWLGAVWVAALGALSLGAGLGFGAEVCVAFGALSCEALDFGAEVCVAPRGEDYRAKSRTG